MEKQNFKRILELYNKKKYHEGEESALNTINQFGGSHEVFHILGVIQIQLTKYEDAISNLKKAIELKENFPDAHNNLGTLYNNLKEYSKAIKSFEKAIDYKHDFYQAYYNLGNALKAINKRKDAELMYQKSISINGSNYNAINNLGVLFYENKKFNQAIEQFNKALNINPNIESTYNNLGNSYSSKGLLDKALNWYKKSLEINPRNFKTYNDIGNAYTNAGHNKKAIDFFKKSINLNPDFAENYSNIGSIYNKQGKIEDAILNFKLALEKNPNLLFVNYNIAMILFNLNETKEAMKFFKESGYGDFQDRVLQCQYKLKLYKEFNQNLENQTKHLNTSRLVASLSSHAAINFKHENKYNFCKNPLDFIYKEKIDNVIIKELAISINNIEIDNRHQGLLYNGTQSSGNIFNNKDTVFDNLENIIYEIIDRYKMKFQNENCEYINRWPKITSIRGWFVKMKKDGFLKPHIHEGGWLSGVIYLKVPKKIENQGMIEFGLDGHNYPKLHENFPSKIEEVSTNDIVIFPSSLFHQTIPFESEEERICIAFDINP